jgi:hypothetical protein
VACKVDKEHDRHERTIPVPSEPVQVKSTDRYLPGIVLVVAVGAAAAVAVRYDHRAYVAASAAKRNATEADDLMRH